MQIWFFGVQQDLGNSNLLDLSFNGNYSSRLPIVSDYNHLLGNFGRNSLRGLDFYQWDLSIDKSFRLPFR